MKKLIPIILIVVLLGGQLAIIGSNVVSTNKHNEQVAYAALPEPLSGEIGIEQVLPNANQTALAWNSDAVLVQASMQIDWPTDWSVVTQGTLPPGGWVLLGYVSGNALLTMRIERGGGNIVQAVETPITDEVATDYLANPIDLSAANQPAVDAAKAFDIAQGSTFRQQCPAMRGQSYLHPAISAATGQWVWSFLYINRRANDPTQYMSGEMDWATGTIDQVVDADLPCDA